MTGYKQLRSKLLHNPRVRAGYDAQKKMRELGQVLRAKREEQSLSQQQVAERARITQSDVSRLEAGLGVNGPTLQTLRRLVHALDMKLTVEIAPQNQSKQARGVDLVEAAALRVEM
jgi:transcriptional regulator with XRE-family HTH domain